MKKLLITAIGMICICMISQSVFAQCDPRSDRLPFVQIRGDLEQWDFDGNAAVVPDSVTLVRYDVDGIECPAADYDWFYPFGTPGYYKLEFWLDTSIAHNLAICVQTTTNIGGNDITVTGGFDQGGVPGTCDSTVVFPAASAAILADILTPVQLSSFTATAN